MCISLSEEVTLLNPNVCISYRRANVKLGLDDIEGIQSIYGKKRATQTTNVSTSKPPQTTSLPPSIFPKDESAW